MGDPPQPIPASIEVPMASGLASRVSRRSMRRGVAVMPPCIRPGRNRRPDVRRRGTDPSVFLIKRGCAGDPGGFGNRLVGKVRRRITRRAEILAAVGRHFARKCRDRRQRKAGGGERRLQPRLHDFPPTPDLDNERRSGGIRSTK